ncbi:MAG: hypothetical protein KA224_00515 [Steroidobacteraceae bacterium]|nr:hypothetical protein [Steroidobacteraceae bacterium]
MKLHPILVSGLLLAPGAAFGQAVMQVPAEPAPATVAAPVTVVVPAPVPAPAASVLPPVRYAGTVAGDELFNLIQANPRFAKLSKDLPGSPLMLRVTHSFEMTAGGKAAGLTSAILAGSTLGLLPVVTNNDVAITYEFVVNGVPLSTWVYRRNFTRSQNIFATDTTYGLGKEGLAWARSTVNEFLAAAAGDAALAALVEEYGFYFPAKPAS